MILIVTLAATLLSVRWPAPAPRDAGAGEQARATSKPAKAEINRQGGQQSSVVLEEKSFVTAPAKAANTDESRTPLDSNAVLVTVFTGLLALFTFGLALMACWQWRAIRGQLSEMRSASQKTDQQISLTREQLEITRQAALAAQQSADAAKQSADALSNAERAFIDAGLRFVPSGSKPAYVLSLLNLGRTPGLVMYYKCRWTCVEQYAGMPKLLSHDFSGHVGVDRVLCQGDPPINLTISDLKSYFVGSWREIESGEKKAVFQIVVAYEDIVLAQSHSTLVVSVYEPFVKQFIQRPDLTDHRYEEKCPTDDPWP